MGGRNQGQVMLTKPHDGVRTGRQQIVPGIFCMLLSLIWLTHHDLRPVAGKNGAPQVLEGETLVTWRTNWR